VSVSILALTRAWKEIAFVVLLPPVLFVVYSASPINQAGNIDAFVYTGYINNFQDLVERFGLTYYSVRFGMILPGILLTKLLGGKAGYLALTYVFYLVAGVPLYLAIRKSFGPAAACLGYLTFLGSVWIGRTLLGQYVAAAVVAYLIGAIGLVLIDPTSRRATYVVVGALCALAVHAQFFAAAFALLAVIPYWVVNRGAIRARALSDTLCAVAGAAGVTGAGVLFYWWTTGEWNIFRVTASMLALGNEPGISSRPTDRSWYLTQTQLLYPPFILAAGAWLWVSGRVRCRAFTASLLYAVAGVTFFSIWDLYGTGWAHRAYFSMLASCLLPLACMIPVAIVGAARLSGHQRVAAGVLIASAPLAWAALGEVPGTIGRRLVLVGVVLALVAVGWAARSRPIALAACALFALASHLTFAVEEAGGPANRRAYYAHVFDSLLNPTFTARHRLEWDTYGIARKLVATMPRIADDGQPLRFWYPYEASRNLGRVTELSVSSVQSTYLFAYSSLQGTLARGSPELRREERAILNAGKPFHLALLATRREQLDEARAALGREGVRFVRVFERALCEGARCLLVDLLDVDAKAGYWLSGGPEAHVRTLLGKDARGLQTTLERNVYGRVGRDTVLELEGDRLVFRPTSRRDVLATPFFRLDDSHGTPRVGLRVTRGMPASPVGRCELAVQTPRFEMLLRTACGGPHAAGRDANVSELEVPVSTEALRLLLMSADGRRVDVPSTVQVDVFPLPSRAAAP
jgi:hypothetical protein